MWIGILVCIPYVVIPSRYICVESGRKCNVLSIQERIACTMPCVSICCAETDWIDRMIDGSDCICDARVFLLETDMCLES